MSNCKNSLRIYLPLVLLSLVFFGCSENLVFEASKTMPNRSWQIDNPATFVITVADTVKLNDIYINVRNTDKYKFSNLYVFLETTIPDGGKDLDTLECNIADEHGKWTGDGLGDLFDNQILFASNVRFKQMGKYTFTFTQGMRINPLQGISDFGLRVVEAKK